MTGHYRTYTVREALFLPARRSGVEIVGPVEPGSAAVLLKERSQGSYRAYCLDCGADGNRRDATLEECRCWAAAHECGEPCRHPNMLSARDAEGFLEQTCPDCCP